MTVTRRPDRVDPIEPAQRPLASPAAEPGRQVPGGLTAHGQRRHAQRPFRCQPWPGRGVKSGASRCVQAGRPSKKAVKARLPRIMGDHSALVRQKTMADKRLMAAAGELKKAKSGVKGGRRKGVVAAQKPEKGRGPGEQAGREGRGRAEEGGKVTKTSGLEGHGASSQRPGPAEGLVGKSLKSAAGDLKKVKSGAKGAASKELSQAKKIAGGPGAQACSQGSGRPEEGGGVEEAGLVEGDGPYAQRAGATEEAAVGAGRGPVYDRQGHERGQEGCRSEQSSVLGEEGDDICEKGWSGGEEEWAQFQTTAEARSLPGCRRPAMTGTVDSGPRATERPGYVHSQRRPPQLPPGEGGALPLLHDLAVLQLPAPRRFQAAAPA